MPDNPTPAQRLGRLPSFGGVIDAPGQWAEDGLCVGHWDLFDPKGDQETREDYEARSEVARAICRRCPVLRRCRRHVEDTPRARVMGTWAGVTWEICHPNQTRPKERTTTFPEEEGHAA